MATDRADREKDKRSQYCIKLGLLIGLIGAAAVPVCYEVYANVSRSAGLLFIAIGAIAAAVKLIREKVSGAVMCFAVAAPIEAGFGIAAFMVIHKAVRGFLEENSRYFSLSVMDSVKFFAMAAAIQLIIPVLPMLAAGLRAALRKFKANGELAGKYIENAFDDDDRDEF